eukprot:2359824-Pleurochrysis_carterae.AAC.4
MQATLNGTMRKRTRRDDRANERRVKDKCLRWTRDRSVHKQLDDLLRTHIGRPREDATALSMCA